MFFLKTNENDCNFWSTTSWLAITTVLFWNFLILCALFSGCSPKRIPFWFLSLPKEDGWRGKSTTTKSDLFRNHQVKNYGLLNNTQEVHFQPDYLGHPKKNDVHENTHILFNHWLDVWCPFCCSGALPGALIHHPSSHQTIWISGSASQWTKSKWGIFEQKTSPDTFHVQKNEEFSLLSCKAYRKTTPPPKQKWRRSGTERKPSILGWSALYCMVHAWSHAKWLVNCRRTRKICLTHTIRVRYIDLHENHKNQPNVSNYTIHGWYG